MKSLAKLLSLVVSGGAPILGTAFLVIACSSESAPPAEADADAGAGSNAAPAPSSSDNTPAAPTPQTETCDASKKCSDGKACVTSGSDKGFCASACGFDDGAAGCRENQRCGKTSADARHCLDACSDTDKSSDCPTGFICSRSVGSSLGKYGCVRSCEGIAGYCGDSVCEKGVCAPKFVCDANTSGVTGTATLGSLSSADRGKVCDFTVCKQGGYGKETACGDGITVETPSSQSACKSEPTFTKCGSVTVAQFEACTKKMNADPCKSLEVLAGDAECAPVKACILAP